MIRNMETATMTIGIGRNTCQIKKQWICLFTYHWFYPYISVLIYSHTEILNYLASSYLHSTFVSNTVSEWWIYCMARLAKIFGEFIEVYKPKTSPAKYSVDFKSFAESQRQDLFDAIKQIIYICMWILHLYVKRSVRKSKHRRFFKNSKMNAIKRLLFSTII